ncbi:MAG: hypothetical protein Q4A06_08035 [Cardiobacteriaceae bacterium]|nr:hypothetical protein [Cardiobacteriaceae bacterium]
MLAQAIATPRKKSATTLPKNHWNKSRLADSHEEKQPHFHGCPVIKAFSIQM